MNEAKNKKIKSYTTQSVNIDNENYKKIINFQESTYSKMTFTKIINLALVELFDGNSDLGKFINGAEKNILVPIDKYATLFSLTLNNVKNKLKSGSLEEIKIAELSYIKLYDDDLRNIFVQQHIMREELSELKKEIKNLKEKKRS